LSEIKPIAPASSRSRGPPPSNARPCWTSWTPAASAPRMPSWKAKSWCIASPACSSKWLLLAP